MNEMNHINDNNYHEWVERFLDAETTLEQERELYVYFSRADLPAGAEQYRSMFGWYDTLATSDPAASSADTHKPQPSTLRILPLRLLHWAGIAAAVAILVTVGLNLRNDPSDSGYIDEDGYICSGYIMRDGKKITDLTLVSAEFDRVDRDIAGRLAAMDSHMDSYSDQVQLEIASSFNLDDPAIRELVGSALDL